MLKKDYKLINVRVGPKKQKILIGDGSRNIIFDFFKKKNYSDSILIVDANFKKIHKNFYDKVINDIKPVSIIDVKPIEKSKSLDNLQDIVTKCYESNLKRSGCIIALGGGIVGDISGVVASLYMRGVDYVFIPTTLMSQADTIISKVAISYKYIKNILGSFYSPVLTICDPYFLMTLDKKEISMGLSEVIKSALIDSNNFVTYLDNNIKNNLNGWKSYPWEEIIYRSLRIKSKLVSKDPFDTNGKHKGLSYGHTYANVYEGSSKFNLRHGEAVALGMISAGYVSSKIGILCDSELQKQNRLIEKSMLPRKAPSKVDPNAAISILNKDKLSVDNSISLVLLKGIGNFVVKNKIDPNLVKDSIKVINP